MFKRVGSHVVQVHGYASALEYKHEHGLMAKETRTEEHSQLMRNKVTNQSKENLKKGAETRFKSNDGHAEHVKKFWSNRKSKKGYVKINTRLGSR